MPMVILQAAITLIKYNSTQPNHTKAYKLYESIVQAGFNQNEVVDQTSNLNWLFAKMPTNGKGPTHESNDSLKVFHYIFAHWWNTK